MMAKRKPNTPDIADLISISEAARVRGVSHTAIQDLIKRDKLAAVEVGGRRLLSRRQVEGFQPEPVGRPQSSTARTSQLNRVFRQATEATAKATKKKRGKK